MRSVDGAAHLCRRPLSPPTPKHLQARLEITVRCVILLKNFRQENFLFFFFYSIVAKYCQMQHGVNLQIRVHSCPEKQNKKNPIRGVRSCAELEPDENTVWDELKHQQCSHKAKREQRECFFAYNASVLHNK